MHALVMSKADIDEYIIDTKVTRFPIGELELSPEYFLELLPQLQKPVGNIHFCGDYTDGQSFISGASSFSLDSCPSLTSLVKYSTSFS